MADGSPSATARRVAAYRLRFDRPAVGYGCPEADDALARDVAEADGGRDTDAMDRYLRGRTSFFDRVVIRAIERGVTQVVNIGAGYDGRSLRYAKSGVGWWEVDHHDTQSDKIARLERLGIDAAHVTFVGHDLRAGGLASAVVAAGFATEAPSLLLCEGVALYLDLPVLEALLAELRRLATGGSRLALSLSGPSTSPERAAHRERLEAAVAALGESARNALTPSDASGMFDATGWRQVSISGRAGAAGFVMLAPAWARGSSGGATSAAVPTGAEVVRAFLPSRDLEESKAFYRALGFDVVFDGDVVILQLGRSQFILTSYFDQAYAENSMMQVLVDDLDGWWSRITSLDLARTFGVRAPKAPAHQEWGLRVAFVTDPAGVLWHFTQDPDRGPLISSQRELLDFDARALLAALDAERARRGLSWAGVAAAIWDQSHVLNARRGDHPISASTITGMRKSGATDCQHALFMLRWLAAEPEAFLAGAAPRAGAPLPEPGPEHRIRWDLALTASEVDRRRRELGLTWPELARQLRCTPAMLTGIRRARFTINMGLAMRISQWLDRPAAHFVYVSDW